MSKGPKKSKQKERPSKEERLFQNLLKITEQFMTGKGFTSLNEDELMARLALPEQHRSLFKEVLESLTERNLIDFSNGRYSWKKELEEVVTGIVSMHQRGFGFVQPIDNKIYTQDIFIPKHLTNNAVDGDTVEVVVNQEVFSEKGPEGKIVKILERGRTHIAGIVRAIDKHEDVIAYAPLLGLQQKIVVQPSQERVLQVGDRIVMEVVDWGKKETETVCRLSHFLGHISDPSCDISAAIEEFELRADFPNKVIEEAHEFGERVTTKDCKGREDLRYLETFTIDPDTAKDFDDALSLSKNDSGYQLAVHIADVSHYVKTGSALDIEAQQRGNSTYFPGYCLPMLPSELSNNLCSLKANVIRLTVSVLMELDSTGELTSYRIVRGYIKSVKRFTYREAKEVLDGKKKSPHAPTLKLMVELCKLLKKKRYERGSIEFSLPDLAILVDENGVPYKTDYITYDITHQLVEEFMLKANEIVARHLTDKGINMAYRVHDEPAEEQLRDFFTLAAAFGFNVTDMPSIRDLQKLFEEAEGSPYANYLAASYIRRLRLALYSAENIGHYGLSLSHYCHFTSPIRRYVDLVIHRLLFGESDDLEYLQTIAHHCSEQERLSAKAENRVVFLKKLRFLDSIQKQDPYKEYQAIITRVKNFGFHFEILDLLLEGFLHIAELEEDYFIFEEQFMRLRGKRQGIIYASGDRIVVQLRNVDFISMETKWEIIERTAGVVPSPKADHKKTKQKKNMPGAKKGQHTKKIRSLANKSAKKKKPKSKPKK